MSFEINNKVILFLVHVFLKNKYDIESYVEGKNTHDYVKQELDLEEEMSSLHETHTWEVIIVSMKEGTT